MAKRKARSHDNTARKKLSHITQQAYQDESTNDFMSISNSFICDASLIRSESASDLVGKRYLETKAAKSGTDETSEVHKRASGRLQRRQREELSSEKNCKESPAARRSFLPSRLFTDRGKKVRIDVILSIQNFGRQNNVFWALRSNETKEWKN